MAIIVENFKEDIETLIFFTFRENVTDISVEGLYLQLIYAHPSYLGRDSTVFHVT